MQSGHFLEWTTTILPATIKKMKSSLREEASLVADRLRAELRPSAILLFGSVARGSEIEGSDLDICLLFEKLPGRKLEIMRSARRISRTIFRGAMDIVAYSNEEWEAYIAAGSSFEVRLKREAVTFEIGYEPVGLITARHKGIPYLCAF
jgi:predicted nucleotidyltransferase